jgi:hypothetical protein
MKKEIKIKGKKEKNMVENEKKNDGTTSMFI